MGSQSGFGRIRSWVLKENPRGTIPGTGAATGAATTATGKAPPGPGAALGKPGEARGEATANGRADAIGRRGIRADATVTQVPAARTRPETIGAIPGGMETGTAEAVRHGWEPRLTGSSGLPE